ncbi:MAG: hypothetical protein WC091_15960 [Sulfuricellaceae bacterium]
MNPCLSQASVARMELAESGSPKGEIDGREYRRRAPYRALPDSASSIRATSASE